MDTAIVKMCSFLSAATHALSIPELVLQVISYLDPADLARVARVKRGWAGMVEPRLYRDLRLSVPRRVDSVERSVAGKPKLGSLVREVYIQVECNPDVHHQEDAMPSTQAQARVLATCSNLGKLLIEGQSGSKRPRLSSG